ncbi:MAG: iron ABC transporter permease [Nitrososphaeria archaeon]|nr:iron ABC transporter permease [Nitrososphaeria archaeon]
MSRLMVKELEGSILKRKLLRWKLITIYLSMALVLTVLASTAVGPIYIPPEKTIRVFYEALVGAPHLDERYAEIILQIRLPRVLMGILVGAILSVAGAVMQGLFRNPLADPYVLGVSSGASFGAALSMTFLPMMLGVYTTPLAAFLGGATAIFLVYNIVRLGGGFRTETMLLAGISVAYLFSAMLSVVIWLATRDSHLILLWVMGGLSAADWVKVEVTAPIMAVGIALAYMHSRDLNALLLGEENAQSLGVNVGRVEKTLPLIISIVTSGAVAFSGAIGFVGLMMPHLMRGIVGPDHRILIPISALAGGIFLAWADCLARCLSEIPVGVITALSGVPFFIYLLRRSRRI